MTGFDCDRTTIESDVAAHKASGKLRYSVTAYLVDGGTVCRWTDERDEAFAHRAAGLADQGVDAMVTFDHWFEEPEIFDARGPANSLEQARAELDEALDRMFERWVLEDRV